MNEDISQIIQNNLIKPMRVRLRELKQQNEKLNDEIMAVKNQAKNQKILLIVLALISLINSALLVIF